MFEAAHDALLRHREQTQDSTEISKNHGTENLRNDGGRLGRADRFRSAAPRTPGSAPKTLLAKSEMGALLCFDMNNVRYITATHIGTWAQDKISRFTLLPQNDEPILWDFGSAAKHHQLNCPWLGERSRAGISLLRGAMSPEMGRAEDVAQEDPHRTRKARPAQRAARHRRRRTAGAVRAAERRHHGRRRPAAHVRRARHQDAGRDRAAQSLRR